MANYISGSMRIKGAEENILSFLSTGIGDVKNSTEGAEEFYPHTVRFNEGTNLIWVEHDHKNPNKKDFWIKGSKGHFIPYFAVDCHYDEDSEMLIDIPISARWNFDSEVFCHLSEKYNIDIRVVGYELGAGFGRVIETERGGEISVDETLDEFRYVWEIGDPY